MHSAPIDKAVNVVGKKHDKARERGNVRGIRDSRHRPQNYKNDVVKRVCKRVKRTAAGGEVHCGETRSYRDRADYQVCVTERAKDKIERYRYRRIENRKQNDVAGTEDAYPYFAFRVRMPNPRYKRKHRHRRGHSEIGYHFAVVTERDRYNSVEHGETEHHNLSDRVTFRAKNYRRYSHERTEQREVIASVEN